MIKVNSTFSRLFLFKSEPFSRIFNNLRTNKIYLFVDTVKKLLRINSKKMFNLKNITRILNFVWKGYRNIKGRAVNRILMERTSRTKKERKERKKESTCSFKFYVMDGHLLS